MDANKRELADLLRRFVEGPNRSVEFANEIEGFLIAHFYEDDAYQELLESLARFRPGGGDYLLDEVMLLEVMRHTLANIDAQGSE